MYLPRPPVVLAACWIMGILVCVINAHSPDFVPASQQSSAVMTQASTGETPLSDALRPSRAWAETVPRTAANLAPSFTRIIISLPADISFEGTGTPGDVISLHIDGTPTTKTRVDDDGLWRVALAHPLSPGDHAAMAVATTSDAAPRSSEEVRIAIPQLAPPVYAPPTAEPQPDAEPPNAATRRRAAELARDANSYFDKLTTEKQQTPKEDESQQASKQQANDDTDASEPEPAVGGIAGWLARARHEYNEVLVAGLSDPSRRGSISQSKESDLSITPPLPERPHDNVGYIQVAMNWLQQANREYQEQLVAQLKLRGASQPSTARDVAAKDKHTDLAALPAASNQTDQGADEKRLAALKTKKEEEQATEARRLEAKQRAEERRSAQEAERRRVAAEREALARRLAEEKQQAEKARGPQETDNTRALEKLLAEREKFPAPRETEVVKSAPTLSASGPDKMSKSEPTESQPSVAGEAEMPRSQVVESVPPAADIKVKGVASVAVPEANPLQLSRREQATLVPPVPEARSIVAKTVPMPSEKLGIRRSEIVVAVAEHDEDQRRSAPEGGPALDRHRWCSNPRAGRTIHPPGTYIVAYGDTLWDIAERHYNAGYLYKRIRRANRRKIAHSRWIYPCQRLWLPRMRVRRR